MLTSLNKTNKITTSVIFEFLSATIKFEIGLLGISAIAAIFVSLLKNSFQLIKNHLKFFGHVPCALDCT